MGAQEKTVGGGAATGLADDFVHFLQGGLQTGTFGAGQPAGAGAFGATQGIASVLNGILGPGGGTAGNAMQTMMQKETDRQANDLRARFGAMGGTAFGTGAQHAEGVLRAEAAPQQALALNQMQLSALLPLLHLMGGISQMGIPQRQTVMQPNPWMEGASALGGLAQGIGSLAMAF